MPSSSFEARVGFGLDVHPFAAHEKGASTHERLITLCGIKFPFEFKLAGHSDADVGLHAIVDALLGAMAEGDIGQHFPADDPAWKGADSSRFLLHTYQLLKRKGGEIVHLDITFVGEAPRIAPHRDAMRMHIADFLKLSLDRVSVKATTTEKLGFLGRSEGLAAHAVATVRLPV